MSTRDELLGIIRDLLADYDDERGFIFCTGDPGCIECTSGTTPNHLNTRLCAFHRAKAAVAESHKSQRDDDEACRCDRCTGDRYSREPHRPAPLASFPWPGRRLP